jgi:hypothetical protein
VIGVGAPTSAPNAPALTDVPSSTAAPTDVRNAVTRPSPATARTGTGTGRRARFSGNRLAASPSAVTATPPATSSTKWLAEASTTNVVAAG